MEEHGSPLTPWVAYCQPLIRKGAVNEGKKRGSESEWESVCMYEYESARVKERACVWGWKEMTERGWLNGRHKVSSPRCQKLDGETRGVTCRVIWAALLLGKEMDKNTMPQYKQQKKKKKLKKYVSSLCIQLK